MFLLILLLLLNNFNRDQMKDYYMVENLRYMQKQYDSNWTGNLNTCDYGDVDYEYQKATIGLVNYYRTICGLPPITEDTILSEKCKAGALIMYKNNILRHDPPPFLLCWTQEGADAAGSSDVAATAGPTAIEQYVEGSWAHRGWVLYPPALTFGTGSVGNYVNGANCLWVFGQFDQNPVSQVWEYVAYPPPGYVPYQILPNEWGFSLANANFSNATVSVKSGAQTIPTTIIIKEPFLYGNPCIIWKTTLSFIKGNSDKELTVKISNVVVNGQSKNYQYIVTIFDPGNEITWKGNSNKKHHHKN